MISQRDINRRQQQFVQKGINERITPPKIIQMGGGSGSGAAKITWATVIEAPLYPNPPTDEGRAYYTCRPLTDRTAAYNPATTYALGAAAIYDNLKYISLQADNTGHQPDTSPAWWEQSEEIRIEYIVGWENVAGFDIRNCGDWIEAGEIVELISKEVESVLRYYIRTPSLTYSGLQEDSTERYNTDLKHKQNTFR